MFKRFMKKPQLTTLRHYKVHFKTVDGELHTFSKMCYCDESTINCTALDYYLIGMYRLQDDEGIFYPISNVIKIFAELDDTIENVIVDYCGLSYGATWYKKSEIEVYKDE